MILALLSSPSPELPMYSKIRKWVRTPNIKSVVPPFWKNQAMWHTIHLLSKRKRPNAPSISKNFSLSIDIMGPTILRWWVKSKCFCHKSLNWEERNRFKISISSLIMTGKERLKDVLWLWNNHSLNKNIKRSLFKDNHSNNWDSQILQVKARLENLSETQSSWLTNLWSLMIMIWTVQPGSRTQRMTSSASISRIRMWVTSIIRTQTWYNLVIKSSWLMPTLMKSSFCWSVLNLNKRSTWKAISKMRRPTTSTEKFRRSWCPCNWPSLSTSFLTMTSRHFWDLNSINHKKYSRVRLSTTCVSTSQERLTLACGNSMGQMPMEVRIKTTQQDGKESQDPWPKKSPNQTRKEWITLSNWVLLRKTWLFRLISTSALL